ncbi:hypothetical protein RDWZM_000598 [Blomia tropicalis]|uniref:Uncharacterized protein n=1 Tax=Blomia tropicalis TaxID=40697 RepID=A0A9Q0RN54_BLOTA|nr:hypothetical protein BLOT_012283 [Blomia tropicalis]KAJ6222053.1 hypothetical protein RDWZM_000598 [Blomia tropicalis]
MDSIIFDEGSLTKVITRELELGLYPQYIGEEKNVINKLLRQRKFNYNPDLNGILLGYSHLEFLNDTGRIIDDGALIFWKIKANFNIFNITTNQLVKSKLTRVGKKYLGCTLVGCIDVTIKFDEQVENEIEEQIIPNMSIDNDIIFKVKSFVPSQRYIEGIIDEEVFRLLTNLS